MVANGISGTPRAEAPEEVGGTLPLLILADDKMSLTTMERELGWKRNS